MRGKLDQPKGLIELIMVELERIDLEYREFWISYEYTCPGGEYKSAMGLPITNSRDMTNTFFRELLNEAKRLSELDGDEDHGVGFYIANKAATVLPIKNICQRVINLLDEPAPLEENIAFIDLSTSGFNFKDADKSLSSKEFDERFKIFVSRAREKMAQNFYTLAADDLEKAKILCSTSPLIYKLTGICHRELGHMDLALEMFEAAIRQGDREQDTFLYLAEINFFLNNMEAAESLLEMLLEEYPEDIRGMVELANVRYQMDKDYIDVTDKAYELNPAETASTIMHTFVFKKVDQPEKKRIAPAQAAAMLNIPEKLLTQLALRHRIPTRIYSNSADTVIDECEIKAWAFVYRRYNLLQNEIDRVAANKEISGNQGMAVLS